MPSAILRVAEVAAEGDTVCMFHRSSVKRAENLFPSAPHHSQSPIRLLDEHHTKSGILQEYAEAPKIHPSERSRLIPGTRSRRSPETTLFAPMGSTIAQEEDKSR